MWSAYRWTGDKKYLQPLLDDGAAYPLQSINSDAIDMLNLRDTLGKQIASSGGRSGQVSLRWQMTGDTRNLEPGLSRAA